VLSGEGLLLESREGVDASLAELRTVSWIADLVRVEEQFGKNYRWVSRRRETSAKEPLGQET